LRRGSGGLRRNRARQFWRSQQDEVSQSGPSYGSQTDQVGYCKDTRVALYVCVFSEKKDTINSGTPAGLYTQRGDVDYSQIFPGPGVADSAELGWRISWALQYLSTYLPTRYLTYCA